MMIILFFSIFCAFYFYYLYFWVQSCLSKEYHFASTLPPETLPHSSGISILISIIWGLIIVAGIFWGFTYNRYPYYLTIKGEGTWDIIFLVVMCIALGLSFMVVYHLGEIKGITSMKQTVLFQKYLEDGKKLGSDPKF